MSLFQNPFARKHEPEAPMVTSEEPQPMRKPQAKPKVNINHSLGHAELVMERAVMETVDHMADFRPSHVMRDIPVHKKHVSRQKRVKSPLAQAIRELSPMYLRGDVYVGDCFDIPHEVVRSVAGDTSFVYQIADLWNIKVVIKKTRNGDYRVWRKS